MYLSNSYGFYKIVEKKVILALTFEVSFAIIIKSLRELSRSAYAEVSELADEQD